MGPRGKSWCRRSLGLWTPLVLTLALFGDLASRFVSYDRVAFRAWEAMIRGRPTGLGGMLAPNRRYTNDRSYGDLAAMGNYPSLRQYRREVFTTDEFGMRNRPAARSKPWGGILAGTSFSLGSGVNDDETLSERLGQILDTPIYNAARGDIGNEQQLRKMLERLGLKAGFMVLDITDGAPLPSVSDLRPEQEGVPSDEWEARFGPRTREFHMIRNTLRAWLAQSPLKLTIYQGFKRIEDDVILPNRFADLVVREELSNGDPVLLATFQIRTLYSPPAIADATGFCRGLATMLRRYHMDLLVVLIPSQYRIYGPLLRHPGERFGTDPILEGIESGLRAGGVPVINLTPVLTAAARDGLAAHRYIYFRDDTHWNAQGIALAATALASKVREMMTAPGSIAGRAAIPPP